MKACQLALLGLLCAPAFAQQVTWEPRFYFGPSPDGTDAIEAINLVHVFDGSVGVGKFLGMTNQGSTVCPGEYSRLWNPALAPALAFEAVPNCRTRMFCQGHSALADGRILNAGGPFVPDANLFSPMLHGWNNAGDMAYSRWYPTCTTMPDGKVLVSSGFCCDPPAGYPGVCPPPCPDNLVRVPELYNPGDNSWMQLSSAFRPPPLYPPLYPYMFVLPDGSVLEAGPGVESRVLDTPWSSPATAWTWGTTILNPSWPNPPPPPPGYDGSAVMYEPGKIMRCGGQDPAVDTTWVLDASQAPILPEWLVAGRMQRARRDHNLVILPDGKVLAVGGNTNGAITGPVFEAEIFDPASGKWTLQPPSDPTQYRMYHSTAALLPDGRVVSTGGESDVASYATAQIFKPPYITDAVPRTTIVQAPAIMQYGQSYLVGYFPNGGPKVSKACLVRLAATTHGFDQDQRYVPLKATPQASTSPTAVAGVNAPANANLAPPGYSMLFLLAEYEKNKFAPSQLAAYVRVGP